MTGTDVDGWWPAVRWHEPPRRTPRVVAFQGERGAYGDLAIDGIWCGAHAPLRERCWDFDGVIEALVHGRAEAAVLPVFNVIVGEIAGVAASIDRAGLRRLGDATVPVRHCLLGQRGSTLASVTDVWSHPVALAQCAALFASNPRLSARETYDTAGAAREVAARRRAHEAAIAHESCASRYELRVLARDVGDRPDNATRFVIVGGPA